MCGIIGYTGRRPAAPVLIEGLKRLEYRGYDSAGVAVSDGKRIAIVKRKGKVCELECALRGGTEGNAGIGHTRWATHGGASERNAHPHRYGGYVLVHNGIVENDEALRTECIARGETFLSETDSETVVHLLARGEDPLASLKAVCGRIVGSYALAVMREGRDTLWCARRGSPLVVGKGETGLYAASDLIAIADVCDVLYALPEEAYAVLEGEEISFYDRDLRPVFPDPLQVDRTSERAELGGFRHYMRKEMSEIPAAIARSLPNTSEFSEIYRVLCQAEYIQTVACGTAYHSCLGAKYAFEKLCRMPVEAYTAGEYRYCDPIVPKNTLVLAVSQSGETADTLAAARLAKERGATTLAVTNVPASSLARAADFVLPLRAGREIAVAATKSYNAQLAALYSLVRALAVSRGKTAPDPAALVPLAEETLKSAEEVRAWTPYFAAAHGAYFIGRGADYVTALEGSLKLKEISYLAGEGYPAGELKHGTLALIDEGTPVVAVITDASLAEKTMNAVSEVGSRGARVFLVTCFPELARRRYVASAVTISACEAAYSPAVAVIPLFALAYYTAIARGNDPDKPRNLAKSVTVE